MLIIDSPRSACQLALRLNPVIRDMVLGDGREIISHSPGFPASTPAVDGQMHLAA